MGYTEINGDQSCYVDDDGTVWESYHKKTQLHPDTKTPLSIYYKVNENIKTNDIEIVERKKPGRPKKAVI